MRRISLALCLLIAIAMTGISCGLGYITIYLPASVITTYSFDVDLKLAGSFIPNTLRVLVNGQDVTVRFSGGPNDFTATITPGSPLLDSNTIEVRALRNQGGLATSTGNFSYEPPGKAHVREITLDSQRTRAPSATAASAIT